MINLPTYKEEVAMFGCKDSLAGRVFNMLCEYTNYEVKFFISVNELPEINIELEHRRRPNRKTEFAQDGTIFGKDLYIGDNYIDIIAKNKIKKVFVVEDDRYLRSKIFKKLRDNEIEILSFFHPTTILDGHNTLGEGIIIFPKCYIGYKADIKDGVIIESNVTIEHHNVIGNYVDINPNLTTGGFTLIEDFAEINMSVDIFNMIRVGKHSRIGGGSLVINDCDSESLYFGRPAKYIRSNKPNH
jgi:acetyltransferase-like isoleucine patch superfamily enzyme